MNKMKRLIAASLVIAMAFCAAACGKSTDDKEFVRGEVSNNVYVNTFAGLKFTPGPDWSFSSDEEILEMMDIGKEYMSDKDKLNLKLNEQKVIVDMQAVDSSTGDNVIIQFENLSKTLGGTKYTEEDYVKATKESLEASQMEYTFGENETVELCGGNYLSFEATTSFQGVTIQQRILTRRIGDYMMGITITSYEGLGVGTAGIADLFSAAE